MNWLDEGALYSSIGLFLREDLGRGDITTQTVLMRNARARGRFVAGEKMVVAGLEAAEEVFATLDPQQQLEAFTSDGEEVEAGKVIARTNGFADVLLAGERVALNLLQHLSGVATTTRQFVRAVEGTKTKIADTRKTTPGLRDLELYAVRVGGGVTNRTSLADAVLWKDNHWALLDQDGRSLADALRGAGDHAIIVEVESDAQLDTALAAGVTHVLVDNQSPEQVAEWARRAGPNVTIQASGGITPDTARAYAEAGAALIAIGALTHSAPAAPIRCEITAAQRVRATS